MRLAIIPARGGSKRIPRKNIKNFCGIPIIAWSIKAALESGCFDQIVVSTDDLEISKIARSYGATTPFIRPAEYSGDFSTTTSVIKHAIEWYEAQGTRLEYVCCIYPTAPFVNGEKLAKGLDLIRRNLCSYVFPVVEFDYPVQRAFKLVEDGAIQMLDPSKFNCRSQDLEGVWHDAGQFYWGTPEAWKEEVQLFDGHSRPIKISRLESQDIDSIEDWKIAELKFKFLLNRESQ